MISGALEDPLINDSIVQGQASLTIVLFMTDLGQLF